MDTFGQKHRENDRTGHDILAMAETNLNRFPI